MTKNYTELYKRNAPIITMEVQQKLSQLRVGVAGCGSTGGAYIDGLSRLGIQHFHLSDNGSYELNNLNRQFVFNDDLGANKAAVHARRIQSLNSEAKVTVWDQGLNQDNLHDFISGCDLIFDAVDVTTPSGMTMKLLLHKALHDQKIPASSALDLGFTQWVQSYNYHRGERLLKGRYDQALTCQNPLKALILGFSPIEDLPLEISLELIRLLKNPDEGACQLACACFALAAAVTPYMIYFVRNGELPPLFQFDLIKPFESSDEQLLRAQKTKDVHETLRHLLEVTP